MKNQIIISITLLAAMLLVGCGEATKTSSTNTNVIPAVGVTTTLNGTDSISQCNQGKGSLFTAQIKLYQDAMSGFRNDFIKMKLSNVSSELQKQGTQIVMYRWQASGTTYSSIDSTPLQFRFETNTGTPVTSYYTSLTYENLKQIAAQSGIANPMDLFTQLTMTVDLRDANGDYQAIKISFYDQTTAKESVDMLIPAFKANPNTYSSSIDKFGQQRAPSLVSIHPLVGYLGQSLTEGVFQAEVSKYCF